REVQAMEPYLPRPTHLGWRSQGEWLLATFRCQTYWLLATRAAWRGLVGPPPRGGRRASQTERGAAGGGGQGGGGAPVGGGGRGCPGWAASAVSGRAEPVRRAGAPSQSTVVLTAIEGCRKVCVGIAGWSSPVARWAHNPKVAGSNPAPATKPDEGLAGTFG